MCTRGRAEMIGRAVASVLGNDHDSFEMFVIDQSDDDSTRLALAEFLDDERFHYVHLDRIGLSHAYNVGIQAAAAPLLAFTDDDCVAPRDWLRTIETTFSRHADVELIYGQTLAAPEMTDQTGVLPALPIGQEEKLSPQHGFRVYGMGANFALRRSLIDRIGGFDEALGGGGPLRSSQDFDFQFRAYRAGAVCLLSPDIWVHHYGIREGQAWTNTQIAYGVGDGAFYLKHIRCGDLLALKLFTARVIRLTVAQILSPIRRRPTQWPYLRSYLTGMRRSLGFQVDRKTRLYQLSRSN
jgi:glycosyltransferase involved in cell wall biosynthesis